jgi:secondary thiamine-phosphate synthase enzyme
VQILTKTIELETKKQFEIINITEEVQTILKKSGVKNGQATVFVDHTTAAVRINHDEPLLLQDIMKMLYRLAPVDINYAHDVFEIRQNVSVNERSNGHAHVKAFLLGSSETIPVHNGAMMLGSRQSIFFVELDGGRKRTCVINIVGS